ncbi:hypothetical protein [Flaviaesturariibacter amylovorans]|uniref:Phosphatase PAP2 family protein n=1 Tax=Flaviaesturariibacter amylovorans TaxID=1084520 RepID=A0ABP8HRJ5_9BACT
MNTTTEAPHPFHPALRALAQGLSVLLHPLFIPVYILLFFLYESPFTVTLDAGQKGRLAISFSLMYILFPLVTVLLAKGLGFVDSIRLQSQKDRIIPYIGCTIYYFWMWYVLHKQGSFPEPLAWFSLAVFLATSAGLVLNAWIKISMHALAAGVAVAFLYVLALHTPFSFGLYLSIGFFVTGLICTARLVTGDHNPFEVYAGLTVGAGAMAVAMAFA